MSVPNAILELVARFEEQLEAYKSGAYNETQLRREFLDPFFKSLGWDMDNEQGRTTVGALLEGKTPKQGPNSKSWIPRPNGNPRRTNAGLAQTPIRRQNPAGANRPRLPN